MENVPNRSLPRKIIQILNQIDFLGFIFALISFILWRVFMQKSPNPIYVPPDFSSINYPISPNNTPKRILDYFIFFGSISLMFVLNLISKYYHSCRSFNIISSIWSVITANCLALAVTCYFKSYVGWPRPNTYFICGYNTNYETCNSSKKDSLFLSWPSYHATQAMSGATFMAFFIQKFFPPYIFFDMIGILMFFAAIYVGANRIRNYKHHPEDVTAGLLIGFIISFFIWKGSKRKIFPKVSSHGISNEDTFNQNVNGDNDDVINIRVSS